MFFVHKLDEADQLHPFTDVIAFLIGSTTCWSDGSLNLPSTIKKHRPFYRHRNPIASQDKHFTISDRSMKVRSMYLRVPWHPVLGTDFLKMFCVPALFHLVQSISQLVQVIFEPLNFLLYETILITLENRTSLLNFLWPSS